MGRRIMGVDYGDRRLGLAISDPEGVLASPAGTIHRRSSKDAIAGVVRVLRELGAEMIVLGLPLLASGDRGQAARRVERFGQALALAAGVPVLYWEETYSTVEARARLLEAGYSPRSLKARIDSAAAAIILQNYLDHRP